MNKLSEFPACPMVSCIICFYNEEKYISEAIDSLLMQTYDNYELILINNGSIDGSVGIAKAIAQSYPEKVRYYEHHDGLNKGTAASKNLGIRFARGKYICFLDADDIWLPDKLFVQVKILEHNNDVAAIISPLTVLQEDGSKHVEQMVYKAGLLAPKSLIEGMLRSDNNIPHLSCMVRTNVLQGNPVIDEFFKHVYEDAYFFSKINLHRWVYFDTRSYHLYRVNPKSVTCRVSFQDRRIARLAFLNYLIKQLSDNGAGELLEIAKKKYKHQYKHINCEEMYWHFFNPEIRCIEKNRISEGIQIVKEYAGYQLYGPYSYLKAGRYKAVLEFVKDSVIGNPYLHVCSDGGKTVHASACVIAEEEISIEFNLNTFCNDLEICLDSRGEFSGIYLGLKIILLAV